VPLLKRRVETKAYAYGVSSTIATLLGEYVVELLTQSSSQNDYGNL
jgi:hypothetical protein